MQRYNTFDDYYKSKFKTKVYRLSIDLGFTCPNRDGRISYGGCNFCSEKRIKSKLITDEETILSLIKREDEKITRDHKSLIYLSSFTNTYARVEDLEKIYKTCLEYENSVGLIIATRADCLSDDILELLSYISKNTYLIVEIGMQTVNENSIRMMNRGYTHSYLKKTLEKLDSLHIKYILHTIIGLEGENTEDYLNSIKYINSTKAIGIKFHNLYIEDGSKLLKKPFEDFILEKDEYVKIVSNLIGYLKEDIIIHRLCSGPNRDKLIYPKWAGDKARVISSIQKYLKDNDIYQGKFYKGDDKGEKNN